MLPPVRLRQRTGITTASALNRFSGRTLMDIYAVLRENHGTVSTFSFRARGIDTFL